MKVNEGLLVQVIVTEHPSNCSQMFQGITKCIILRMSTQPTIGWRIKVPGTVYCRKMVGFGYILFTGFSTMHYGSAWDHFENNFFFQIMGLLYSFSRHCPGNSKKETRITPR